MGDVLCEGVIEILSVGVGVQSGGADVGVQTGVAGVHTGGASIQTDGAGAHDCCTGGVQTGGETAGVGATGETGHSH